MRNRLRMNPQNLNIIPIIGDGNCLFRSISCFVYGTEDLYARVRREIYNEVVLRSNNYPGLVLKLVQSMHINEYIPHMKENGFFGGELEISIAASIYNINIAT